MSANFRLLPWTHIDLGDVIKGTLRTDDVGCQRPPDLCQQFALALTATGTLEVSVTTQDRTDMDIHIETPDGRVYGLRPADPLRIAVPVFAGSTVQILVMSFRTETRPYKLTTRLR